MQPALPIVHVDGRLVGRSIVLSPLVGPLEFGSLEHLKFISDLPPLVERRLRPGESSEPTLTAAGSGFGLESSWGTTVRETLQPARSLARGEKNSAILSHHVGRGRAKYDSGSERQYW
jgi:hypothetical protein